MSAGLSFLCVLASLPGPPQWHWSNFTFQLWSVNRRKCPDFDPYRDTIFHLYTKANPQISRIIIPFEDDSLIKSGIDFSLKTIIFFHGFLESHRSDDAQTVKNGYLEQGKYNVILVQNERLLAGPYYITAAQNCKPIAQYSARFIDYLVSKGMKLKHLHVIGLSLGGQIAGMTGQFVKSGKLLRITAFDPAGPLFNFKPINERIDPSDAEFVDVINTNSGLFGMKYGTGHLNFWPNGGRKQPGCDIQSIIKNHGFEFNWLLFCNHYRSYQLYAESIKYPKSYPSKACKSYLQYELGGCKNETTMAYMGILANSKSKGNFYLDTGYSGIYNG